MTSVIQTPPPGEKFEPQPMMIDVNNITPQQKVAILHHVHTFFATFDRVPGALAKQWANALDALAVLANYETKSLQETAPTEDA
jgi:hypothetical protein